MRDVLAVGEHQHFAEGRGLARVDVQKIDIYRVAFRDAILPSASLNDCIGHNVFSGEKKPRKFTQKGGFDKRKTVAASLCDARTFRRAKRLQTGYNQNNFALGRLRFVVREQFASSAAAEFLEFLRELARDAEMSIWDDVD